jgi:hypothetical protein
MTVCLREVGVEAHILFDKAEPIRWKGRGPQAISSATLEEAEQRLDLDEWDQLRKQESRRFAALLPRLLASIVAIALKR